MSRSTNLQPARAGLSIVRRSPPVPSAVFDTYWRFATERQEIYFRRLANRAPPWTADTVLNEYRFTNVYRASDRVSQYLINGILYAKGAFSAEDTILRVLLFKVFNKIETWQLLERALGSISRKTFDVTRMADVLSQAMTQGTAIYSGAYIMPSGSSQLRRPKKHLMHLQLLRNITQGKILASLLSATSMKDVFTTLLSVPTFGPFLAYQFATDLNYSSLFDFSEMDFVVPGPGAKDGIKKCFMAMGEYNESELIRWVADRQEIELAKRGLNFRDLWGRPLQLIDCQNLFCEVDKYARVAHPDILGLSGRSRIKQRFTAAGDLPAPAFPPKWGLTPSANTFIRRTVPKRAAISV